MIAYIIALVLLEHVKHEVENASCYAILADEVKDACKKSEGIVRCFFVTYDVL